MCTNRSIARAGVMIIEHLRLFEGTNHHWLFFNAGLWRLRPVFQFDWQVGYANKNHKFEFWWTLDLIFTRRQWSVSSFQEGKVWALPNWLIWFFVSQLWLQDLFTLALIIVVTTQWFVVNGLNDLLTMKIIFVVAKDF